MKRILILLVAAVFLVACGSVETSEVDDNESKQEDEIETLSSDDISIELAEDENITIELEMVNHGRDIENDFISLHTTMTNKQNRTYEMYLKELVVDGTNINRSNIWLDEEGIDPEAIKDVIINGYDDNELTVDEHIAGIIVYNDHEGNRHELKFNKYINE